MVHFTSATTTGGAEWSISPPLAQWDYVTFRSTGQTGVPAPPVG